MSTRTTREQFQLVRQRLAPCPPNHRDDADWTTNHAKQVCQTPGCVRALCEWCAAVSENPHIAGYPTYRRFWCADHAQEAP